MKNKVQKAKPLAAWLGGKSRLAKTICPLIDQADHEVYVEPFFGMGSIFLGRNERPRKEVINDRNEEIMNLFRVVQSDMAGLVKAMAFMLESRSEFERLEKLDPTRLDPTPRAARFLYLQRLSFGGKADLDEHD